MSWHHSTPARGQAGGTDPLAGAINDFALSMYGQLRAWPGNVLFSPFSLHTALAMALAGARGETAVQMAEVLRTPVRDGEPSAIPDLLSGLSSNVGAPYELAIANSLWGQDGARLLAEYVTTMVTRYGGEVRLVDFHGDTGTASATIDRWVATKTKGRISGLIPPGALNQDTRLVLVNAVYFKGKWVYQFDAAFTEIEPFHLDSGGTVDAPLMFQEARVRYLEAEDYRAAELDYKGGDLAMLVMLPEERGGLEDFEKSLDARKIEDCVARMTTRRVKLYLPRFTLTWGTTDLVEHLAALGMRMPFDRSSADLSGINGHGPPHAEALFLSAVLHKAFAEVNEEGTEAAAATAVAAELLSLPPPEPPLTPLFRADHPFLFAIRERTSGALLFFGRVSDPTLAH